MPYIDKQERLRFDPLTARLSHRVTTPGELNYVITTLCLDYLEASQGSYQDFNEVIGVLECAKLELYRRAVALYEDKKIAENGDVYPEETG